MSRTEENIRIADKTLDIIENEKEYIHLGHIIKMGKENQTTKIKRRIKLATKH